MRRSCCRLWKPRLDCARKPRPQAHGTTKPLSAARSIRLTRSRRSWRSNKGQIMAFAHGGEFGYWNGIDIPPPAVRPRPIATPGYTAEVQARLAAQAQARAGLAAA